MRSAISFDGMRTPEIIWLAYGTLMQAARLNSEGLRFIPTVCHPQTRKSIPVVCGGDNARWLALPYDTCMDNVPANHLRAWREFRQMSQDDLANRLDTTKGVISLLENGHRPLSDKWLHRLAEVLETRPGHILDIDPHEMDNDIVDIWTRLSQRDRLQAASILRTFIKTGTHD